MGLVIFQDRRQVKDMPQAPPHLPSQRDALALHQRLLARDPTASNDLAEVYIGPLVAWLAEVAPRVEPEIREDAAGDALLTLIRNPESYSPILQTLEAYLRMSAHGDMLNALAKEQRHRKHETPCGDVELLAESGKYGGHDSDPGLSLRIAEEEQDTLSTIPESVRRRLSETDLRAAQLVVQGERSYAVFAELYGLLHLPADEQARTVKRHKDRLKMMLKRAGGTP